MAIFKHINIKNDDYSASVRYLWFQHDEKTGKPLRGEDGHCIRRDGVIMDSLNCGVLSFDFDCRMANRKYGKNQQRQDIKAHHWILSFDPKDMECGLTTEQAQEMGMAFALKHFGGHQCLVATHNDGHNGSKNIHVHIVCNSLRVNDLPEQPVYSKYERDRKAGYKLHPTREMMEYLKEDVMHLCRSHGLHQVELNKPAQKRVTDKEYWAQKRGQARSNDELTRFQTELEKIRTAIDAVKIRAETVEEFKDVLLKDYSISIRDKRGRWSYKPADRKQGVTARRLGDAYTMESVTDFIAEQVQRRKQTELNAKEQEHRHTPVMPAIKEEPLRLYVAKRIYNLNEPKYKNNLGLQQWAKLQNLKEMSRRFNFLCEFGIHTEALVQRVKGYQSVLAEKTANKSAKERQLKGINNLLRWEGQLNKTKVVYGHYRSLPANKRKQFWQQHQSELELHRSASQKLTEYKNTHGYNDRPLPSMKQLSAMKTTMGTELKTLSEEIALLQSNIYLLSTAQTDVMSACEKLNLVTRSEYADIFGRKMSVRSQVNRKKGQPEKHSYDNNPQRQGGYGLE